MTFDLFSNSQTVAEPEDILASLDPEQHAAATAPDGAVLSALVLEQAKLGRWSRRIVHLIRDRKVPPASIMAVTFTNKAAREIRERVAVAVGEADAAHLSIGTFHALSARILRRNAMLLDLPRRFQVIPEEDSMRAAVAAVRNCGILPEGVSDEERAKILPLLAKQAFDRIQSWKSWGLTTAQVEDPKRKKRNEDDERFARAYVSYQNELLQRGMVDFGDLVLMVVELFSRFPQIRDEESEKIRHLLVDEAQDANPAQVRWARSMSFVHQNIFVVGDEDQSIFSFQGGYPGALLDLVGEDAHQFGLTLNRRCTDQILKPAVKLVGWNRRTGRKELNSGVDGDAVGFRVCGSEREEATWIASSIKDDIDSGIKPDDVAILVRSGWLMKPLEEALLKAGIDYEVVGGVPLMGRKEVKVVVSYLRLAIWPRHDFSFPVIVDEPRRGVGEATKNVLENAFAVRDEPFYEICKTVKEVDGVRMATPILEGLAELGLILEALSSGFEDGSLPETKDFIDYILDGPVGYRKYLEKDRRKNRQRLENLRILERVAEEEPDPITFLQELALLNEDDHKPKKTDVVRISTMHSSKGLEWESVYCPALEMDVTPNKRALADVRRGSPADPWNGPSDGGIEEERRLVHVAFTRAKRKLVLSCALNRGGTRGHPSPFLPECGIDPMMMTDMGERRPVKKVRQSRSGPRAGRKGFASLSNYD